MYKMDVAMYEPPEIEIEETNYDLNSYYEAAGNAPVVIAVGAAIVAAIYSKNCRW